MATNSTGDPLNGKKKADVFREAIEATGGPHTEALGAIKNYIDEQYPDFPWSAKWHAEISGAKSGLRSRFAMPSRTKTTPQETSSGACLNGQDLQRAKEFIERIGGGELEKAKDALEFIRNFGSLERIEPAMEAWSELLDAVGGDAETADKVLAVVTQRFLPSEFPRLAEVISTSDAA